MGPILSTNLCSCNRNFPTAQCNSFQCPPLASLPPTSRHAFWWKDKMNQYVRSPNDKISANGGEVMSKGKLKKVMESEEPISQDRVVREVLLLILNLSSRLSKCHGIRPGRNPHTVIRTIRSNFAGYLWFMKGDISELLDHVDVDVVMNCLQKVVKDRKVLGFFENAAC